MGGTRHGRQPRTPGPTGGSRGQRAQQTSQLHLPTPLTRNGRRVIASIYFPVSEHALDSVDEDVLLQVALHCLARLLKAEEVRLRVAGYADTRYREDFNETLSKDRAEAVERSLRTTSKDGSLTLPSFPSFHLAVEWHGERFAGSNWAEDRRVDVIDETPPPPPPRAQTPKPEEKGFFHYMLNQHLLRPYMFRHYSPRYSLWRQRGLDYLVDLAEKEGGPQLHFSLRIQPKDYDKVLEVIEQLADFNDWQRIQQEYRTGDRGKVIAEAYEVEYRKAWEEARRRAYEDFERSDYRHPWEFFALKFGLVPKGTPYHKRLKNRTKADYEGTPTYLKGVKGH